MRIPWNIDADWLSECALVGALNLWFGPCWVCRQWNRRCAQSSMKSMTQLLDVYSELSVYMLSEANITIEVWQTYCVQRHQDLPWRESAEGVRVIEMVSPEVMDLMVTSGNAKTSDTVIKKPKVSERSLKCMRVIQRELIKMTRCCWCRLVIEQVCWWRLKVQEVPWLCCVTRRVATVAKSR